MSKKYIIVFGVIVMMFTLLLAPNICISAAKDGLLLWFNKILPSLLPFIILINILSQLNIVQGISRLASPITQRLWKLPGSSLFVVTMGFVAGYPMGAKVLKQLIDHKALSAPQAQKLLCFSNNCGPLFIVGTVGTLMLNSTSIGYFLLIIHILSALLLSLIFSFYNASPSHQGRTSRHINTTSYIKFSYILNEAVSNAMDTIVYIGGYIIFFSVIASIIASSSLITYILDLCSLQSIPSPLSLGVITGLLELTNGANMISGLTPPSLYHLALISFLIGFGGLCVHFQTSYILGECSFSLTPYIMAKFMQGVLSFILLCLFYPFFSLHILNIPIPFEIKWVVVLTVLIILFIYIVKYLNFFSKRKSLKVLKNKYTYNY